MFRPTAASQMTTPLRLQTPTTSVVVGVSQKDWKDVDGTIMANFKTYGGTEIVNNNILSVEDTAQVVCWFRPDITSGCRVVRLTDNAIFEILGEPENIEQRNQFLSFKVRRIKGGV